MFADQILKAQLAAAIACRQFENRRRLDRFCFCFVKSFRGFDNRAQSNNQFIVTQIYRPSNLFTITTLRSN
jgi:hypothetical protein